MNSSNTSNGTLPFYQTSQAAISIATEAIWLLYSIVFFVLLIVRWKQPSIQARRPLIMLFLYLFYCLFMFISPVRYIVGRERFPCFLHFAGYAFTPVGVILKTYICWRLILKILEARYKSSDSKQGDDGAIHDMTHYNKLVWIRRLRSIWTLAVVLGLCLLVHIAFFIINMTAFTIDYNSCSFSAGFPRIWLGVQLIVPLVIYLICYFVCSIVMLVKRMQDTWGIFIECFLTPLLWLPFVILWAIGFLLGERWPEAYFSVINFLYMGAMADIAVTCMLPLLRTLSCSVKVTKKNTVAMEENTSTNATNTTVASATQPSSNDSSSELRNVLSNEEFRKAFLQYMVKSFCPEQLLFWNDVKFKYMPAPTAKRLVIAQDIIKKYILDGALYQLNLPQGKNMWQKDMDQKIKACQANQAEELPENLFAKFITHAEVDMLDSLSRYKRTNEYQVLIEKATSKRKCGCC